MEIGEMFFKILQQVESTKVAGPDRAVLLCGLRYLHLEAQQPKYKRGVAAVKDTWLMLWPLLQKYRLLETYRRNDLLKWKLQTFMNGKAE